MAATTADDVRRTFLTLSFLTTFAASLIRGIDALFLLDAGLSTGQVFAVYACMTASQVLFEIPTGAVADVRGRRLSYLLGIFLLAVGSLAYWLCWYYGAGFWSFASVTALFGIAYTFSSGATEAWLVDALDATGYQGKLDDVFSQAQAVNGAAMLIGTLSGGAIAQVTNLGVPNALRALLLFVSFGVAFRRVFDLGFTPQVGGNALAAIRSTAAEAVTFGLKVRPIRLMSFAGAFMLGVTGFIFYAMQPYLLDLYGDEGAYLIASLAATIVAGAQIIGGATGGVVRRLVPSRTTLIAGATVVSSVLILAIALTGNFYVAVALLALWSLALAVVMPVRQAFLNSQIASERRATVLSFDSLVTSAGAVPAQPALGRVVDLYGYPTAFIASSVIQLVSIPFVVRARATCPPETDRVGHAVSASSHR